MSLEELTLLSILQPADGLIEPEWVIYTDGSQLDGPTQLLRRTGWAFVALDHTGTIQASAHGVPPPWIDSIFGAEAWAVFQAVLHSPGSSPLRIDCKAAVDLLLSGVEKAVSPSRRTARVWAGIFAANADFPPQDVSWMPAHTISADVG